MSDFFQATYGEAEGLRLSMATLSIISLVAGGIAFFRRNAILQDADKIGRPSAVPPVPDAPAPAPPPRST